MKRAILVILAVMLTVGVFTATQAQAGDPLGIGETIKAQVEDSLTLQIESRGRSLSQPRAPDRVEISDTGSVLAIYEGRDGLGLRTYRPPRKITLFLDGEEFAEIPIDPSKEMNSQYGMLYHITVEFTLGEPVITIEQNRQLWWRGNAYLTLHPESGGYAELGPPSTFIPQAHLQNCNYLLKPCNNCPLVCIEPGWTPPVE